ncbi:unnamed protein product [Agarophyton chilense]
MNPTVPDDPQTKREKALRILASIDARLQCYSPTYTFLLSYCLGNIVLFFFAAVKEYENWKDDAFVAWTVAIARGTGFILNLNIAIVILLASRKTLTFLRSTPISSLLPLDHAMPEMHTFVAVFSFALAILHGILHSVAGITRKFWAPGFGKWTYCFATGCTLVVIFVTIFVTAVPPARRTNFERFIHVHFVGAALFLPLLMLHGFYDGVIYTYRWILAPTLIYCVDKFISFGFQNKASLYVRVGAECRNSFQGGEITRLSFPKPFHYRAGQYAELCIPLISRSQWHPFTMASAPQEENILFFIKKAGDWTGDLYNLCKAGLHPRTRVPVDSFEVKIRGPYGAPAQHVGQYEKILLISGGVGATPFCSVTKEINEEISRNFFQKTRMDDVIDMSQSSWPSEYSSSQCGENSVRGPDILDAGRTLFFDGLKRPRKQSRPFLADIKKTPHMIKTKGHDDLSVIPTQTRSQFLYTLASTSMFNTIMLWLLLLRLSVCLLAVCFSMVDFEGKGTDVFRSPYFTWVDDILSGIFFAMLLFAMVAELVSERRATIEEWLVLLPLAGAPFLFDNMALAGRGTETGHIAAFEFYVGWPILVLTFLFRYFRIVGRRALLSDTIRKSYQTTKSVDFIWTTKTRDEDKWLIEELSKSVGSSSFVRLHRFITREETPEDQETSVPRSPGSFRGELLFRDNYGRPNWPEIFQNFTAKMKNGTTAGIFFCGPPKMAAEVKQAATMAMFDSRYRSISTAQETTDIGRMQSLLFSQNKGPAVPDSLSRSFNVRYVFREEKF